MAGRRYKKRILKKRKYMDKKKGHYVKHKGSKISISVNVSAPSQQGKTRTGTRSGRVSGRFGQMNQKPPTYQDYAMLQTVLELRMKQYLDQYKDLEKKMPDVMKDITKLKEKKERAAQSGDQEKEKRAGERAQAREDLVKEYNDLKQQTEELQQKAQKQLLTKQDLDQLITLTQKQRDIKKKTDDLSTVSSTTRPQHRQPQTQPFSQRFYELYRDPEGRLGMPKEAFEEYLKMRKKEQEGIDISEKISTAPPASSASQRPPPPIGKNPRAEEYYKHHGYLKGIKEENEFQGYVQSLPEDVKEQLKEEKIRFFTKKDIYDIIEEAVGNQGEKKPLKEEFIQKLKKRQPDIMKRASEEYEDYLKEKEDAEEEAALSELPETPIKKQTQLLKQTQSQPILQKRTPISPKFIQPNPKLVSTPQLEALQRARALSGDVKQKVEKIIERKKSRSRSKERSKERSKSPPVSQVQEEYGLKKQGEGYSANSDQPHSVRAQDQALSIQQLIQLLYLGIDNSDEYDIILVDDYKKKPHITKDKQIFIFFFKLPDSTCYHFTIGIHEERGEFAHFDPLAIRKRQDDDMKYIQRYAHLIEPEVMMKFKSNYGTPWQNTLERKEDECWCGEYCYVFAHNYINLGENYKEASEFQDREDRDILMKAVQFSLI